MSDRISHIAQVLLLQDQALKDGLPGMLAQAAKKITRTQNYPLGSQFWTLFCPKVPAVGQLPGPYMLPGKLKLSFCFRNYLCCAASLRIVFHYDLQTPWSSFSLVFLFFLFLFLSDSALICHIFFSCLFHLRLFFHLLFFLRHFLLFLSFFSSSIHLLSLVPISQ